MVQLRSRLQVAVRDIFAETKRDTMTPFRILILVAILASLSSSSADVDVNVEDEDRQPIVAKRLSLEELSKFDIKGGWHRTEVAFALLTQQPRVRIPAFL